jgi:hypothetical protein
VLKKWFSALFSFSGGKMTLFGFSLLEYRKKGDVVLKLGPFAAVKRRKLHGVWVWRIFGVDCVPLYKKQQARCIFEATELARKSMRTISLAQAVHPLSFSSYKGAFAGKDVYLIATGPSLVKFQPVDDAVYVGVNQAFQYNRLQLNFLFLQDFLRDANLLQSPELMREAAAYVGNRCVRFYGVMPDRFFGSPKFRCVPEDYAAGIDAKRYYLDEVPYYRIARNPAVEPLGDFGSIAFSALQFILYGRPERIFLVGCDCTNGSYLNIPDVITINTSRVEHWKEFQFQVAYYYADMHKRIISINPIGLAGIFTDRHIDSPTASSPVDGRSFGP